MADFLTAINHLPQFMIQLTLLTNQKNMKIFRNWMFKWWEAGLLKVGLISFGILVGLYFYENFLGLTWFLWALFVISAVYFIIKFLREE